MINDCDFNFMWLLVACNTLFRASVPTLSISFLEERSFFTSVYIFRLRRQINPERFQYASWSIYVIDPTEYRDHFVYAPSQWETTLHCNVASHWLGAYTKWSPGIQHLATWTLIKLKTTTCSMTQNTTRYYTSSLCPGDKGDLICRSFFCFFFNSRV